MCVYVGSVCRLSLSGDMMFMVWDMVSFWLSTEASMGVKGYLSSCTNYMHSVSTVGGYTASCAAMSYPDLGALVSSVKPV